MCLRRSACKPEEFSQSSEFDTWVLVAPETLVAPADLGRRDTQFDKKSTYLGETLVDSQKPPGRSFHRICGRSLVAPHKPKSYPPQSGEMRIAACNVTDGDTELIFVRDIHPDYSVVVKCMDCNVFPRWFNFMKALRNDKN